MSQVDEGLIHAWLDGQLKPDDATHVERMVATDPAWGAAAAEARGLIAGASRILGALDDVPRLGNANQGARGPAVDAAVAARRSWVRAPWVRAAAVVVFVTGVGGVVWRQTQQSRVAAPMEIDILQQPNPSAPAPPAVAERVLRAEQPPQGRSSSVPPSGRATPGVAAESRPQRSNDQGSGARSIAPLSTTRLGAPAPTSNGIVRTLPDAVGDVAKPGTNAATFAKKETVAGATAASASGASANRGGAGVGGGGSSGGGSSGGGRGGRGGGRIGLAASRDRADELKTFAAQVGVDPRLAGCWAPVDSGTRDAINERRKIEAFVLRFVEPVVTDVPRLALPAAAPSPPRQSAAVSARVQNAMVTATADSTFAAEWISGDGRTRLTFAVRGDTLIGTTRLSAGDVAYPLTPFRATRTLCPP